MRCSRERPVLFLHFVFTLAATVHGELSDSGGLFSFFAEQGQLSLLDVSTVHPVKATADGDFISHSLAHHFEGGRARRDLRPLGPEGRVYYKVDHGGRSLMFNLTANKRLLSSDYVLERRNGTTGGSEQRRPAGSSCHLLGTVEAPGVRGTAAISTCEGLAGFFLIHTKKRKLVCGSASDSAPCVGLPFKRLPDNRACRPAGGGCCSSSQPQRPRLSPVVSRRVSPSVLSSSFIHVAVRLLQRFSLQPPHPWKCGVTLFFPETGLQ